MKNPIQIFDKIKYNFILYVKTAFNTRYERFEDNREKLLNQDKVFARTPWVEPLPIYKLSDFKISEIKNVANLNNEELQIFKAIVNAGLVGDFKIYQHQYEMLQKAMEGNHCVITSGTGSGKTESFLLPLFAYLSKELNKWRTEDNNINNTKWWSERGWGPVRIVGNGNTSLTEAVKQRPAPKRPAAIRAMLVYPMNALVEDQLSRIRKALDSDDTRHIFESKYKNNRIYFGRYNSTSPVSGKLYKHDDGNIVPNKHKVQQLKKELNAIEDSNRELSNYLSQNPNNLNGEEIKDLIANFQRLDGAEIRTRFDMQETPPDIMITNFSMLSIMLMRDIENPIFDKTKTWLECNTEFDIELTPEQKELEKKERVFHLIIDELHLYRGGSGSETAYIIRMLLNRIGLTPDSDQLRVLASSASLEGEEGRAFLKSFFGTENKEIEIIEGTEIESAISNNYPLKEYTEVLESIGKESEKIEKALNEILQINETSIEIVDNELKSFLNNDINTIEYLINNQSEIKESLYFAFKVDGRTRAIPAFKNGMEDNTRGVKFISEVLFGDSQKENKNAVKGFFYALGLLEKYKIKHDYPRIRFHLFYRNISGMWGELVSDNTIIDTGMPIGEILTTPQIAHNGHRSLELLYCENCGTLAYGGSRVQYKDENEDPYTELIPVSPDIEGVPETSPATIVEKRKYKDYSIFCPGKYDNIEPENTISNSGGLKLKWYTAWLNINSGRIITENPKNLDEYISGKWLRIKDGDNDIADLLNNITANNTSALPHICPHCEADYSHPMKKKQSPFRAFRTGFGKVNQILSKELFEALPEGDKTKKLVAFSDSREDAAKLAKNIEEEHYNSLLKEVVIHNITDILQHENEIISALESNNQDLINKFQNDYHDLFFHINQLFVLTNANAASPEQIFEYKNIRGNIKSINTFIDIIIQEFLNFGINPGGPLKSIENFWSSDEYKPWHCFFNFDNANYDTTIDRWENVRDILNERIERNISSFIFGRLYYSFEASGLGYATINKNQFLQRSANQLGIDSEILFQVSNSFMRIWGDNYKHNRTDYTVNPYDSYESLPNRRKERRYIRKIAVTLSKNEIDIGNAIFDILQNNHHRGVIEINNLKLKIANRETSYYKCQHCGTVHLHKSGGICVFCLNNLLQEINGKVSDLWSENYLTAKLLKEYKPFRLHTEELTGQTDNQLLRQRQFKNIFLTQKDKLTQQIDLLSVTTTLEVGVDIGALQAIILANMPPQRFNYQQRVGRTGRRGQLYSYSLTFARGRSHDEYYFENPLSITGDKPPQPFLSLDQERIFKRILAKAILRFASKELGHTEGSVHGEFGNIEDYNKDALQDVVDDNLQAIIRNIFNSLNVGIYKDGVLTQFNFNDFEVWISNLPTEISIKISEQHIVSGDLSEFLAEAGILPMAGMPTRIRNLIHSFKPIIGENNQKEGYETLSIDRDLGMAIYEFAPGSQKTKDKGVVQAIGFTPDIRRIDIIPRRGQEKLVRLNTMHDDAFTERKWLVQNNITRVIKSETYNEQTKEDDEQRLIDDNPDCQVFIGASPSAFRTDFKYPKDSSEDFEINISKPLTFAETKDNPNERTKNNYKLKYAQQELTWKINNNGGELFKGKYLTQKKYGTSFERQWIYTDFISQIDNIQLNSDTEESISLASSKVTEVFRIEPRQLDLCLDINPFDTSNVFKAAASKGAFYSTAFLIQRTLADDLDIDPEEIEIAAIDSIELPEVNGINERESACIVLADELPNGSGFIQQLYQHFDKYIQKCVNPTESDKYNYSIINNQVCHDASYIDLKNYRNMNFHPLLDWRLGVGLLRVMNNENYNSGLKDEDYQYPELISWLDFSKNLSYKMENTFENIRSCIFGQLYGFTIENDYKVIVVHPFWNWSTHQSNEEVNILTTAIVDAGTENLYFIDSFNLHRRPGWCYGEIIKKIQNG